MSNVLIVKSFVVAHAGRLRVELQNKPRLVTAALRRDTTAQLLWQTSAARRTTAVCQTGRSPSRVIVSAADFWNLRQRDFLLHGNASSRKEKHDPPDLRGPFDSNRRRQGCPGGSAPAVAACAR